MVWKQAATLRPSGPVDRAKRHEPPPAVFTPLDLPLVFF